MLNTHSVCALLPEKIAFMNNGLFSATTLPTYSKRGFKRAEIQETFGRLSRPHYRSHSHPIWCQQVSRSSEKGWMASLRKQPYQLDNKRQILPALLHTALPVPCTHTFTEHSEEIPKQSHHSPISTWGLLVVVLPQIVVLCFPRVPLPGKARALISHPWGTAGEAVTVLRAGHGDSHRERARGARHGAILPGEHSLSQGARDACPAWDTQGAMCTQGSNPKLGSLRYRGFVLPECPSHPGLSRAPVPLRAVPSAPGSRACPS